MVAQTTRTPRTRKAAAPVLVQVQPADISSGLYGALSSDGSQWYSVNVATRSCTCPSGGSLAYDFAGIQQLNQQQHGPIDVTLRLHADHCSAEGGSVDGSEFIKLKSSGATATSENLFMFLDVHLTMSKPPVQATIDLDAEYLDGKWWYAVEVSDGTLIVASDTAHWDGSTKTGTVYVHAKDASWTCQLTNGKGTCTSDKGDTRAVL